MRKLVLISSHCDTPDRLKILKTNLEILKNIDVKILLYSTVNLSEDITNSVDYYFFNRFNPVKEYKSLLFWSNVSCNGKNIKLCRFWQDTALASVTQMKYLVQLSDILDFDLFYFTLYDLVYTNDVIDFIKNKNEERFFTFRTSENGNLIENNCAMQVFSLNKVNVTNINKLFDVNKLTDFSCTEHFLHDISKKLNISICDEFVVEDHIYQFRNWHKDFYNYSIWEEFKIYFSKNAGTEDPQHIMIYDIKDTVDLFIRIDNDVKKIKIQDIQIYEIKKEYQKFEIWLDGKVFDVLENISKFPGGTWEIL